MCSCVSAPWTAEKAQVDSGPNKLPFLGQSVAAEQSLIYKMQVPFPRFCYQIFLPSIFLGAAGNSLWDKAGLNAITVDPCTAQGLGVPTLHGRKAASEF